MSYERLHGLGGFEWALGGCKLFFAEWEYPACFREASEVLQSICVGVDIKGKTALNERYHKGGQSQFEITGCSLAVAR